MHTTLLLGAGKIGHMIATLLAAEAGDYRLRVGDVDPAALDRLRQIADVETMLVDVGQAASLAAALEGCQSVISALSFHHNPLVARAALAAGASYFDLTEDIDTAGAIRDIAAQARPGQIFMPQCGLAPGFIAILAHDLTRKFETLDAVHMRVGALPQFPSNALNYNLTWSTDGLINEYCNPCQAIHEGRRIEALPLDGLESFSLDGVHYEAFNTSGGLGTLCETLDGRVRELNYRTVRYQGHRNLMAFLVQDLRLSERRYVLKEILERAIPITLQDVVVIFCNVTGGHDGHFVQWSDARKIYDQTIAGRQGKMVTWSAIQITTAAAVCAALDLHVAGQLPRCGFVKQEQIDLNQFLHNRFGRFYTGQGTTRFSRSVPDAVIGQIAGEWNDQPDSSASRPA
jgi:saccharopine dehydrogenase-like NADP-dependent oxidoreductase